MLLDICKIQCTVEITGQILPTNSGDICPKPLFSYSEPYR